MQQPIPIFLALALIVAGPADIAHAETPRVVNVPVYSVGLDLRTEAGAEAMLKRLDRAATRACGGKPPLVPLNASRTTGFEACHNGAMKRAVADLNSSMVAELFFKTRTPPRRLAGF
jgi:UrcA family protein